MGGQGGLLCTQSVGCDSYLCRHVGGQGWLLCTQLLGGSIADIVWNPTDILSCWWFHCLHRLEPHRHTVMLCFQVKDVHVHSELFSVENGLLTPTFKAKRQELARYFRPQVEEMYSRLA